MDRVINYFWNTPIDYQALRKKDDDVYLQAFESWKLKYQPDFVDTEEKVKFMLQELKGIPKGVLTISEETSIGKVLNKVASKRHVYQKLMLNELSKEGFAAGKLWYGNVLYACPNMY